MPSKRDVLALFTRDELLTIVDRYALSPADRRAKDGLVETVASSKKATLAALLSELSRERLVGRWLPDYEQRRARLRELGPSLVW